MKKTLTLFLILITFTGYTQTFDYEKVWATYFGDEALYLSDNAIDSEGNIYFVGYLESGALFYPTSNTFQQNYGGGDYDGFIVKMNTDGAIVWATYFGGEGMDYISGITIDKNDKLYIIGATTSENEIATSGSYQETKDGNSDSFIASFTSNGQRLWSSYFPDFDSPNPNFSPPNILTSGNSIVADNQFIYFYVLTSNPNVATSGVFQQAIGQTRNNLIAQFKVNGEFMWASYYGINLSNIYSIALGNDGLYVAGQTRDLPPNGSYNTYFGTAGSFRDEPYTTIGSPDIFITKFSLSGNRIWSTYYGNFSQDYIGGGALIVDGNKLYLTASNAFAENITTPGSYQVTNGGSLTNYLVQFNTDGERQWGTYIGENWEEEMSQGGSTYAKLSKDSFGNIYMFGDTRYRDNITTNNAFQPSKEDRRDLFLAVFDSSGSKLYGSYLGGEDNEYASRPLINNTNLFLLGVTSSQTNISTLNGLQPQYEENTNSSGFRNIFISKFTLPIDTTAGLFNLMNINSENLKIYPNPNNGNFTIALLNSEIERAEIYSLTGQKIQDVKPKQAISKLTINNLDSGMYFIKVYSTSNELLSTKVVVGK